MVNDAEVRLWGRTIGAVSWDQSREIGVFQYLPEFVRSGIELSPVCMPLASYPYEFPSLPRHSFKGLPGLLADSLPDKFGNAVIDTWLAEQGRSISTFYAVERLCYVGSRGMGALEFRPAHWSPAAESEHVDIAAMVDLASRILDERSHLSGILGQSTDREQIENILRVGASAGGARAKAVLAWNRETGEFRSGQVEIGDGFEPWMIKFDGVSNNADRELSDPKGYGLIEYAYHRIAKLCGIEMSECRLHAEGGRSHFMTRRFDRTNSGAKLHMQSLAAMAHYDFHESRMYSVEQALQIMKRLRLPRSDMEQQFRRAVFNVIGRNQDDHVKNIAFLMDQFGNWRLSPAFDLTYSWNPKGPHTSQHQMSINGKRDQFTRTDLHTLAEFVDIKRKRADEWIDQCIDAFDQWPVIADEIGIPEQRIDQVKKAQRLTF